MHVVLVSPEIAPNTGNIIRLCANTGSDLHLVQPLGFDLDDRLLRRGGLDYHERTNLIVHETYDDVAAALPGRKFAFSSHANRPYTDVAFSRDDVLVFGSERSGLRTQVISEFAPENLLTIPLRPGNRSLNLANAVAVVVFEAWRQHGFDGAASQGERQHGMTSETPGLRPFDT